MRRQISSVASLLVALSLLSAAPAWAEYKVIVHASRDMSSISRATLQAVFLKKTTKWPDGATAVPVDLGENPSVREEFSKEVMARNIASVKSYWLQMIFSGRGTPPIEMTSEDEVIAFVTRTAGAVGYVSGDATLPDGVKAIKVTK
jgi:hypothetical protein